MTLNNTRLLAMAARNPPPQSWYDAPEEDLFMTLNNIPGEPAQLPPLPPYRTDATGNPMFDGSTPSTRAFQRPANVLGRGAIAVCSHGYIGLVTCDEPQPVNYGDGNKGVAWTGIHLSAGKIGDPWCSREPTVIGEIERLLLPLAGKALCQ
jgi:hypothetical protein